MPENFVKVFCENCGKLLGSKRLDRYGRYDLRKGALQFGVCKANPKLYGSYCNEKCLRELNEGRK